VKIQGDAHSGMAADHRRRIMEDRLCSVRIPALFMALAGLLLPVSVWAHSVTFDFSGTVSAADPHSLGGIFTRPIAAYPASRISGSFTFEADTLDSNGSGTAGLYQGAITSLSLSITKPITADVYQFGLNSAGPLNSIAVNSSATVANQSYVVSASVQNVAPTGPIVDGDNYFARDFFINLLKPATSVFGSDALPETPPSLTPFSLYHAVNNSLGQFRLVFSSGHGDHTIIGNLNSLTVVPLPAAAWLFGSGVIGVLGLARRRKRMHASPQVS
jgi:hypothetical protein